LPTDYVRGLDFKITKTSKGGYADYSTSTWARRERALSEAENAAITQHGLYSLGDFLPKKPGPVELKVIAEMFAASVDGEAYDGERWGQYFKPAGFNSGSSNTPASAPKAAPAPQASAPAADNDVPFDADPAPAQAESTPANGDAGSRAADIIAMIRNRNKQ